MQLIENDLGYDHILGKSDCQEIIDWHLERIEDGTINTHKAMTRPAGGDEEDSYNQKTRAGKTASAHGFPYERDIVESIYQYSYKTNIRLFDCPDVFSNDEFTPVNWQFTIYDTIGDHFLEHKDQDVGHHVNNWFKEQDYPKKYMYRKISCSIQLSNPEDYEGCSLQIRNKREQRMSPPATQGSVIAFPSYADHIVTPLTSGKRYAMVGWFFGPQWR
jgi:hypothetical protein